MPLTTSGAVPAARACSDDECRAGGGRRRQLHDHLHREGLTPREVAGRERPVPHGGRDVRAVRVVDVRDGVAGRSAGALYLEARRQRAVVLDQDWEELAGASCDRDRLRLADRGDVVDVVADISPGGDADLGVGQPERPRRGEVGLLVAAGAREAPPAKSCPLTTARAWVSPTHGPPPWPFEPRGRQRGAVEVRHDVGGRLAIGVLPGPGREQERPGRSSAR